MSRPQRIEFAGACYHVMARGNARERIYGDDEDRQRFLDGLSRVCGRFDWILWAYCLMDNHYHLLVETEQPTLSRGMREVNGTYSQSFNRRYGCWGQVKADVDGDGVELEFNLRYAGQYYDSATGWHYNYFRDYEPGTGRYVQSDPIGLEGGANTYVYVDSNALVLIDPTGLHAILLPRPVPAPISPALPKPYPAPIDPALPIPFPNEALPRTGDCKASEWAICDARCGGRNTASGCYVSIKWKIRGVRNGEPIRSEERTVN